MCVAFGLCALAALGGTRICRAQTQTTAPATPQDATAQQVAQFLGKPIGEIRVVTDKGDVVSGRAATLPIQPGAAYASDDVRTAIRQLYATGDYANVVAEASEASGKVQLDFVVTRTLYFGVIRIDGIKEPPTDSTAFASMRLRVGDPFSQSALDTAIENLKEALHLDGLYNAVVKVDTLPDPPTNHMNISVHVVSGSRAKVGAIQVKNSTPYTNEELISKTKLKTGKTFDSKKVQHGEDRVHDYLVKQGFLGARATIDRGGFIAPSDQVPMALEVVAGPRVKVEVTGAKIPAKELKRRVPVFQEGAVDPDLLNEGRRNLRDYFERQGYFDVAVDYKTQESQSTEKSGPQTTQQVITYTVDRGRRQRLVGVGFEGNKYFATSVLKVRLAVTPASFGSRGTFSRALLDSDLASVKGLYIANGFLSADVQTRIEQDYEGKEGDLFVHVVVKEGSQTLVGKLAIDGNQKLDTKQLMQYIGSTPDEPYSDYNVTTDRDNIMALYYDEGFPNAQFQSTMTDIPADALTDSDTPPSDGSANAGKQPAAARPRVSLVYHITEGPQVLVSSIVIAGYDHTRRRIISRQIQLKAGEPLREGQVIDTQRRLYNLGVFARVAVNPQNPEGADPDKALDVEVEEAKRYTIAYGGGFEAQRLGGTANPSATSFEASPRITFEVTKNNFTGRADSLSFKVRASLLQWRGLLGYEMQDWLGNPNLSIQATIFTDKSRDITTFTSTRYEGSVQLTQKIDRWTTLIYRWAYRRVVASDLLLNPLQVPLFSQPTLVSEFGISAVREHRNNPVDATQGSYNSIDLSVAAKPVGSSANFGRLFFQNSTYFPITKWLTFARSTQFGLEQTFAGTQAIDIPLPERFFAGGGNSIRGFGLNEAGPRDPTTGFPIGGDTVLVFQQELRFPLKLPKFGTKLGGALFYDAGNVFSTLGAISLRYTPTTASINSGNLDYFSHTVGFGLRYITPIGPVRVDFAYQINPAQFFECTISGTSCSGPPTLARLPHFQFFFNLGSVF